MLIFESTKNKHAHNPTGPCPYFDIAAPHLHTQPWQRQSWKQAKMTHKHIQTKDNTNKLCETMQNKRYSPIKNKQHNLSIRFESFPLLEFSPLLESYSEEGPILALIVTLLFNVLFLRHFPLYHLPFIVDLLISVLYTQIECTFLSLHHCKIRPLLLIGCKCGLGHGPTLRSNAFFKNCLVYL